MAQDLLLGLRSLLHDVAELDTSDAGLIGSLDLRYGIVPLHIDHEPEAEAMRVGVRVPTPTTAGADFFRFCLTLNGQYWDAKVGLDEAGQLWIHADLDAPPDVDLAALRTAVVDRIDTIAELVDDDLCDYLLVRGLGTAEQLARWQQEVDSSSSPGG